MGRKRLTATVDEMFWDGLTPQRIEQLRGHCNRVASRGRLDPDDMLQEVLMYIAARESADKPEVSAYHAVLEVRKQMAKEKSSLPVPCEDVAEIIYGNPHHRPAVY